MEKVIFMNRDERIRKKLELFNPVYISLENDSAKHAHHIESMKHNNQFMSEGESHYKLTVVSDLFEGLSRIDRQRKILQLLEDEFKTGLHALELKTLALSEFNKS
ncbi:MAG: BolA family protein [Pseudobdellovibrio sp.]